MIEVIIPERDLCLESDPKHYILQQLVLAGVPVVGDPIVTDVDYSLGKLLHMFSPFEQIRTYRWYPRDVDK